MKKVLISIMVVLLVSTSLFALDFTVGVKSGYSFLSDKNVDEDATQDEKDSAYNYSVIPVSLRGEAWLFPYLGVTADFGMVVPVGVPKSPESSVVKTSGAIGFELSANVAGRYEFF